MEIRSWLDEVGRSAPRRPSMSGSTVPLRIDPSTTVRTVHKTQRSQSLSTNSLPQQPSIPGRSVAQNGSLPFRPLLAVPTSPLAQDPLKQALHYPTSAINSKHFTDNTQAVQHDTIRYQSQHLFDDFEGAQAIHMAEVRYAVVAFKAFRSETYQYNFRYGLQLRKGDLVVVEADRGMDMGVVIDTYESVHHAHSMKKIMNEKHQTTLVNFSRTAKDHSLRDPRSFYPAPPAEIYGAATSVSCANVAAPKVVRRLALMHEILKLKDKEGLEAKAVRLCQQKATAHGLDMEILDAEYQFDHNKLTFYYYSAKYVVFNELVQDMFKDFKTRIWMSAVNLSTQPTAAPPTPSFSFTTHQFQQVGFTPQHGQKA